MRITQRITPCLWFDHQAEEAANFYVSIFKNSKITSVSRYTEAGRETHRRPPGSVMTVAFELNGQSLTALNGGPVFKFNEAISLQVNCHTQEEIDHYWSKLGQGGDPKAQQCGWLKDKYGLSWQIVPARMDEMMRRGTEDQIARLTRAFLPMKKLELAALRAAYDGAAFDRSLVRNVVFAQHNLVSDRSFNEFQLIVCRNVMIYFDRSLQNRVHDLFYGSLVRLGILALGHKESIRFSPYADRYQELDADERIYKKRR